MQTNRGYVPRDDLVTAISAFVQLPEPEKSFIVGIGVGLMMRREGLGGGSDDIPAA